VVLVTNSIVLYRVLKKALPGFNNLDFNISINTQRCAVKASDYTTDLLPSYKPNSFVISSGKLSRKRYFLGIISFTVSLTVT
jgi:hypothetical protein